jgi:anti-sigma factor RsiW
MNCEQVREQMDDYLGGYLEAADRQAVESHAATCADCRASLKELQALMDQARQLGPGVSPNRDLWPEILEQIDASRARSWSNANRSWMALAAVLALAVLLLPLLLRQQAPEPGDKVAAAATDPMAVDAATLARADMARSEDRVLLVRRDLVEAIEIRRDLLGPEVSQSVEESLLVLDKAVADIQQALEENPDDRRLRLLLAAKYQHEVRLLQRVSRV